FNMNKIWKINKYNEDEIENSSNKYNISKNLVRLLSSRNFNIDNFLNDDISNLSDPYNLKDMKKFVDRVLIAKKNNEKVCIYGDYDVDGITSITVLYKYFKDLNFDISYYLPDRISEGYGLNIDAINKIKDDNISLVITVDCGITAIEEINYANSLGIDVCVTDHHECSDILPNAYCIINPKQKDDTSVFKHFAGVGVAFKCIMAISKKLNLDDNSYLKYIDIVAIGTISDIVALTNENRIIAKYGIEILKNTSNLGLKALFKLMKITEIDSITISYNIAPRINACGRMGNAKLAVELLLCKDNIVADEIALKLDELNLLRQKIEKEIFNESCKYIIDNNLDKKHSIVIYNENFHNGVIGIVASRLVNLYNKPVILFTKEMNVIRGSGRCPITFSLYDSLSKCSELLISFGGHALAAGMSIEEKNIDMFYDKFETIVKNTVFVTDYIYDIDFEIYKKDLNINLIKDINILKPYGQLNKEPLFLYRSLKINLIATIKDEKHLKLVLKDDNILIEAIGFNLGSRRNELVLGDKIDLIGNLSINSYNNKNRLQINIKDFKKS
ncbi:MAG: single-stranded-DNA-specific exonuclease RecJ, partial [Clostridia bacterium]